MKIQADEHPDVSGLLCQRWTEEVFPFFLSLCSTQLLCVAFSPKLFHLASSGPVLLRSSYIYCSQHGAHTNQTNALAFLFPRTSLACSARPCCASATLCDMMEAGTSNASWWGQMWHLDVIDKLQLSLCDVRGEFRISFTHIKTESLMR